ncbi:serine/threonine protein kinase [Blastopirellula marina]|uniref:non-specific serine/threonine protein kinase n=1 Tax=Blastopirellula marina TaxID=124 RepID=A0A2S8GDD1_9BACT|nr:serine/threonine-protein kinase [Blastopirellula marina]PQO42251.1 hypothetical protein C5Y93_28310 [Blastopirellula marina]
MSDSTPDSDSSPPDRDDRIATPAERLPEVHGSDSVTQTSRPSDRNFLEEPPTVISSPKDHQNDSHSRPYSSAELTLGKELVGQTLGHFHLDGFVGAGGMGAVFRGHDIRLNRRVAVKVLSGEHNAREETVRRFQNEATSAARLDHPNIARVYFVGEDKGWNYIVFEYIDGTNIRDEVERSGPLPIELAISYLVQVAEALDHATTRDVVHRDIKPSNILVDSQHRAKLVDMGLARLHQVNSQDSDLTASGMTLGTFDYISPEQARDPRSADVRSDLYSLGCTFFFMLTGRPPFPEGTVLQKLLSHSGEEPPDPREFRPDLPEEMVHILSRLMAKNPNDRYQKAGELIASALMVIDELALAAPHVTSSVYIPTTESRSTLLERHLPWALPVVILLAIVFVSDAIWSAQDDSWIPSHGINPNEFTPIDRSEAARSGNKSGTSPSDKGSGKATPIPAEDRNPTLENTATPVAGTLAGGSSAGSITADVSSIDSLIPPTMSGSQKETAEKTETPDVPIAANVIAVPTDVETIYEAITMVQDDPLFDTIELRFNGERRERPLLIDNASVTIRAGVGFSPTVVFTPVDLDPPSRMVLITRGSLTLQQVSVKLMVPTGSMRPWMLFEMENAKQLVLEGCQVTVERPDEMMLPEAMRPRPSVVAMRPIPIDPTDPMAMVMSRYSVIKVQDSVIRGEASMIRSTGKQPLRIQFENNLFALSGNLLSSESTNTESVMSGKVWLDLDGCTIDTGGSIIRREGASNISLSMAMVNCIVSWGKGRPFLLQRSSTQTTDQMLRGLDFSDDDLKNLKNNVYDMSSGARPMMLLESTAQEGDTVSIDYADWKSRWQDTLSEPSDTIWATPLVLTRLHSQRSVLDYTLLEDLLKNPAWRPGRRNAGVDFTELPFLPSSLPGATRGKSAIIN